MTKLSPAQEDMLERLKSGDVLYVHYANHSEFATFRNGDSVNMRTLTALFRRGLMEYDYSISVYTAKEK